LRWLFRLQWPVLWDLSGDAGSETRSHRSSAVRRLRNSNGTTAWRKPEAGDGHLRAHKMRSGLTVFGVVLGVSVIMLVAALITGFDVRIQENIKQFGADTAFISRWDQGPHGGGRRPKDERERKPLTLEDAEAIKAGCPAVKNLTTFIIWWEQPHTIRTKAGA